MKHAILLLATLSKLAFGAPSNCSVSPEQFNAFIRQDLETFDQKPEGWRSLVGPMGDHCSFEAAELIDIYHLEHFTPVRPQGWSQLYWHSGQNYAAAGAAYYQIAISRFLASKVPPEQDDPEFKWNPYVDGSVAFLKKDLPTLKAARNQMKGATKALMNIRVLDRFIKCFNRSYWDAYALIDECS